MSMRTISGVPSSVRFYPKGVTEIPGLHSGGEVVTTISSPAFHTVGEAQTLTLEGSGKLLHSSRYSGM
jgi:hypothetical protein